MAALQKGSVSFSQLTEVDQVSPLLSMLHDTSYRSPLRDTKDDVPSPWSSSASSALSWSSPTTEADAAGS